MDKNNEQKNNKTPEMKPKQDSFRPWLKLIPAAAVFAAVCVTCYQADKSPVETTTVSDNNVMSTDEIKELISQGTAGKDFDSEDSSETNGTSISKTSKKTKKTCKKTGTKAESAECRVQIGRTNIFCVCKIERRRKNEEQSISSSSDGNYGNGNTPHCSSSRRVKRSK